MRVDNSNQGIDKYWPNEMLDIDLAPLIHYHILITLYIHVHVYVHIWYAVKLPLRIYAVHYYMVN